MIVEKMYRYLVVGDVIACLNKDADVPKFVTRGKVQEVIVAPNDDEVCDKFVHIFLTKYAKMYGEEDEVDIDDIRWKLLGPADVQLAVRMTEYSPGMCDTMTVGELIEFLRNSCDMDSKIYLVDEITEMYGKITPDTLSYEIK